MTTSSEVDHSPDAPSDEPSSDHGTPEPPSSGSRFPAALLSTRYLIPAFAAVGLVLLGLAYLAQAKTQGIISEGASQALQGWDMLHGNFLLHGWSMSDVSFYTTEIPEYAVVEALRGLSGNTVAIAAALSYFLQVVMAGFLARGRSAGKEAWVRTFIAVGIMLAPTLGPATALLMASPDHIGTHVPLLLIFLVIDRVRPRWWLPVVIVVLLTWAQVADALVLVEGALPIAAVSLIRMYRRRGPWRGQVYDLSMLVAAGLSAGLSKVVLKVIMDAGGFYVRTPIAAFGTPDQIGTTFWAKIENVLLVYGADFFGQVLSGTVFVAAIHLIGLVLVVWALVHVVRHFFVEEDQIAQMFAVAFVAVFAAYIFGTKTDSNEIVGLLPIGAVLAGRMLGKKVIDSRLVPALGVILLVTVVFLVGNASSAPKPNANHVVASWLQEHHYKYGLAGYWNASSVTAETGGNVMVRPIRTYNDFVLATNFETNATWYDPKQHYANFVIWTSTDFCGDLCLKRKGLLGAFGKPAREYAVGNYLVLVYNKNLLPAVPYLGFCGTSWPWVARGEPTANLHCNSHA
ncbi:MAG TPA: hypothetical protein VFQ44_11760 [Streptosporangiaceae bacterium]|nr:hypothetical protein [Streptosporangiaceae bacterium]